MNPPNFEDAVAARARIDPYVHRTPVLTSRFLSLATGADLHFKCENFQKTGSFKARGATNAVFSFSDLEAARGVVTHSSGNHGAALAYAAGNRGIPATVVMPLNALGAKKSFVQSYGGRLVECEPSVAAMAAAVQAERAGSARGACVVHPYNDARVIAGQATCTLELLEQVADLDAIVSPVGGGGLVSGACLAVQGAGRPVKVFAAEPCLADDAHRSFKAGKLIAHDSSTTIADGLRAPLKDMTWHFLSRCVEDVLTVEESEIIDSMKTIWQRMKIVVEPSGAVALAAVLRFKAKFEGKRVGVVLTGGNPDLDNLPWSAN